MLKTDKEQIVAELAAELKAAETLIVADYRGLTNKQLESLRDDLLQHGARFRIVKNTLTRRAAAEAGAESLLVMLEGPTAIAFIESGGDPAAVAKALAAKAKETNVLVMRGGILEGQTLSGEEVDKLATLPLDGRAPRSAGRRGRRTVDTARRAGERAASQPARPDRRPDRAARGAGSSVVEPPNGERSRCFDGCRGLDSRTQMATSPAESEI